MTKTLFAKLWDTHLVSAPNDRTGFLYIDRIFLHERMGAISLKMLLEKNRNLRNADQVFATLDHIVDTSPGRPQQTRSPGGVQFMTAMRETAAETGIHFYDLNDQRQGIVHLVAAEQGIAHPGLTLVCPDSHTGTLGALGMLAWGLGISDAEHALVTRTLKINKPLTLRARCTGSLAAGVTAKDMVLQLIRQLGAAGGRGYVLEYAGEAVQALDMPGRFTLCNMGVELGAFSSLIGVDEATIAYLEETERPHLPGGMDFSSWQTDEGANFDKEVHLDVNRLTPVVTWGTSPEHALSFGETVPSPDNCRDSISAQKALDYMGIEQGQQLEDLPVQAAFFGSCTNARLSDLRQGAALLKGRKVAGQVKAICVPGSTQTRLQAEREGLDQVFKVAGFEWHEAGCSLCFYAGGDTFAAGQRVISTSNRNFEGRQGPGVRTHLASPLTVVASAITGRITDPRSLANGAG